MRKFFILASTAMMMNTSFIFGFDLKTELEGDLKKYANQLPGKGFISDSVEIEGIKLSNFSFMGGKRIISCSPSDLIDCQIDYEIKDDELSSAKIHYFMVGFHNEGPQTTMKRVLGFMSDSGTAKFSLEAPKEEGVYEIRFAHGTGITLDQASEDWWDNPPSSNTTMGIVIVKD